jgi:hypothetical protein
MKRRKPLNGTRPQGHNGFQEKVCGRSFQYYAVADRHFPEQKECKPPFRLV